MTVPLTVRRRRNRKKQQQQQQQQQRKATVADGGAGAGEEQRVTKPVMALNTPLSAMGLDAMRGAVVDLFDEEERKVGAGGKQQQEGGGEEDLLEVAWQALPHWEKVELCSVSQEELCFHAENVLKHLVRVESSADVRERERRLREAFGDTGEEEESAEEAQQFMEATKKEESAVTEAIKLFVHAMECCEGKITLPGKPKTKTKQQQQEQSNGQDKKEEEEEIVEPTLCFLAALEALKNKFRIRAEVNYFFKRATLLALYLVWTYVGFWTALGAVFAALVLSGFAGSSARRMSKAFEDRKAGAPVDDDSNNNNTTPGKVHQAMIEVRDAMEQTFAPPRSLHQEVSWKMDGMLAGILLLHTAQDSPTLYLLAIVLLAIPLLATAARALSTRYANPSVRIVKGEDGSVVAEETSTEYRALTNVRRVVLEANKYILLLFSLQHYHTFYAVMWLFFARTAWAFVRFAALLAIIGGPLISMGLMLVLPRSIAKPLFDTYKTIPRVVFLACVAVCTCLSIYFTWNFSWWLAVPFHALAVLLGMSALSASELIILVVLSMFIPATLGAMSPRAMERELLEMVRTATTGPGAAAAGSDSDSDSDGETGATDNSADTAAKAPA